MPSIHPLDDWPTQCDLYSSISDYLLWMRCGKSDGSNSKYYQRNEERSKLQWKEVRKMERNARYMQVSDCEEDDDTKKEIPEWVAAYKGFCSGYAKLFARASLDSAIKTCYDQAITLLRDNTKLYSGWSQQEHLQIDYFLNDLLLQQSFQHLYLYDPYLRPLDHCFVGDYTHRDLRAIKENFNKPLHNQKSLRTSLTLGYTWKPPSSQELETLIQPGIEYNISVKAKGWFKRPNHALCLTKDGGGYHLKDPNRDKEDHITVKSLLGGNAFSRYTIDKIEAEASPEKLATLVYSFCNRILVDIVCTIIVTEVLVFSSLFALFKGYKYFSKTIR